jgi:hypothetical protein
MKRRAENFITLNHSSDGGGDGFELEMSLDEDGALSPKRVRSFRLL